MAQHDYSIANQGFPATRADINNVLSAIATNNSGTSAPSTQYAGQFWIDTTSTTWTLYIHDGADDIQFATIDTSANTVNFIDSELGDNSVTTAKIADANVTSAKLSYPLTTFSSTGIDDNATSTAITINSSQNVGIGTTTTRTNALLNVNGGINSETGLIGKSLNDTFTLNGQTQPNYGVNFSASVGVPSGISGYRGLAFATGSSERMRIDSSGSLLVGTTSSSINDVGSKIFPSGAVVLTRSGNAPLFLNRQSSDGDIAIFHKDQTEVGSINAEGGDLAVGTGTVGFQFYDGGNAIRPFSITANNWIDNTIDLGRGANRWKDLYLGGGLYVGGTASANKLDDYEEGTFSAGNPTGSTSGTITFSSSFDTLSYIKIGSWCYVMGNLQIGSISGTLSGNYITFNSLPFTIASLTDGSENGGNAGTVDSFGNSNGTVPMAVSWGGGGTNNFYVYRYTSDGNLITGATVGTGFRFAFGYRTA